MFVTIINDCDSPNDFGRQSTRIFSLFGNVPVSTVSIEFGGTYEAAGNLIDMLDASNGEEGIILVNSAPRHGQGKRWPNGNPFGFFYYKKTLVISSVEGYCLSLAKKLGLTNNLKVTDVPTVLASMVKQGKLTQEMKDFIIKTQFRSYEYTPRLARWLKDNLAVPAESLKESEILDIPHSIWLIDGFGNCKTTVLPEEIKFKPGRAIQTKLGELNCYDRLKDVPNGEPGLIIGSSGLGFKRFLEIVVQGSSATMKFNLNVGVEVF